MERLRYHAKKCIQVECIIKIQKDYENTSTWEKKASIDFCEETTICHWMNFMDNLNIIMKKVKSSWNKYNKLGELWRLDISVEVHSFVWTCDRGADGNQMDSAVYDYNMWHTRNIDDINEEGIYLVPDTRYTDEYRDMAINYKNPLEGLQYSGC